MDYPEIDIDEIENEDDFFIEEESLDDEDVQINLEEQMELYPIETSQESLENMFITKNNAGIKYFLIHSMKGFETKSMEEKLEYYDWLLRSRHDIFHYLLLKSLDRSWAPEVSLKNHFNLENVHPDLEKTPDVIEIKDEVIYLIDISFSLDTSTTSKIKTEKYVKSADTLQKILNKKVFFIHLNFDVAATNMLVELNKVNFLLKYDFELSFYMECLRILEEKRTHFNKFVDYHELELLKLRKGYVSEDKYLGLTSELGIDVEIYEKFNNNFEMEKTIISESKKTPTEDDYLIFLKKQLEDSNSKIFNKYKDSKCDSAQFYQAKDHIFRENELRNKTTPKPTHHICSPFPETIDFLPVIRGEDSEQKMLKNFFSSILKLQPVGIELDSKYKFLVEFSKQFEGLFAPENQNSKINGKLFSKRDEQVETLRKEYNRHVKLIELFSKEKIPKHLKKFFMITKDNKKTVLDQLKNEYNNIRQNTKKSFLEYMIKNKIYVSDDILNYVSSTKIISLSIYGTNLFEFWTKTGIRASKYCKTEKKDSVTDTIEMTYSEEVSKMIQFLIQKAPFEPSLLERDFLNQKEMFDDIEALKQKSKLVESYIPVYDCLRATNCYQYLRHQKDIANQLLHFSSLNLNEKNFCVFNAGIPNMVYIVAGCYNKLFSENGKPFCYAVITKNKKYYSSFFGKHTIIEMGEYSLVISNWRRLPTFKLTHIKDTYYSVLGSTMNSTLSTRNIASVLAFDKTKYNYALRTIIGLSTTQRISEILMDNRYSYVSAFSTYTNIMKLLKEKFKPPFRNCLECWLVIRILTRLPIIHDNANSKNIKLKSPVFEENNRLISSYGGKFEMPSLWFDYTQHDINEFLDEAFIYVHTIKEPSNIYHEEVKAVKTILEFQNKYDNLTENQKMGIYHNFQDYEDFLLNSELGCCSALIQFSSDLMIKTTNFNFKKIKHHISNESIGEIISTKAVISDINREIKQTGELDKKALSKLKTKIEKYNPEASITGENKNIILSSHSRFYPQSKPRQKVFETVLDLLEKNNIEKTVELANYFIKEEKGKLVSDICIKSQYGSKREFYVINIGGKAQARIMENFFRKLSENIGNEAISIPGDKKMLAMQNMLDRIYNSKGLNSKSKIMYVNGDCTKWSAAETMSSFISMLIPFKKYIDNDIYQALLSTFNVWSKKEIQIPTNILKKTFSKDLEFLQEAKLNSGRIKSTQNFLQGMFNYSSSYKSVLCTNYTIYLWKKMYPESSLLIEHMEHSDDYVLVCVYEDIREFEKFRVLHKIIMKSHGFMDSERKTNCQPFLMEFVSLISFNGIMLYPQIKKSKEINLNLPCTGFKNDIEAGYSRSIECMRLGCNMAFVYFQQRLQNYCILEAYSLLPNMTNGFFKTLKDYFNTPIELFGVPDMLPVFGVYCKGNGNNYRLYSYGDKTIIEKLAYLSAKHELEEDVFNENVEYSYGLSTVVFNYEKDNLFLERIKRIINWDYNNQKEFWEKHMCYKIMKPKTRNLLIQWLKSMFYNKSFLEAYTKSSRTKMTLRLSKFSTKEVITYRKSKPGENLSYQTIKMYYETITTELNNLKIWEQTKDLLKVITKCDPTYSAIYSMLKNLNIEISEDFSRNPMQIAMKTPPKIGSIYVVNQPHVILQYIFCNEDFKLDQREFVSLYSLTQDIHKVEKRLKLDLTKKVNTKTLLLIYNDLMMAKQQQNIIINYNKHLYTLIDQLKELYTYSFVPYKKCRVVLSGVQHVVDPFTNETLYLKEEKMTSDIHSQSMENLCLLYCYLKKKMNYTNAEIRNCFEKIIFKDTKNNKIINPEQLILNFNDRISETFDFNNLYGKISAYLAAELYGDLTQLIDLVENNYTFSYNYENKPKIIGKKYDGITFGTFTHLKKSYRFESVDQENSSSFLIFNNLETKTINLTYNISLKLIGGLSNYEFEQNPLLQRFTPNNYFKTVSSFNAFVEKNNISNYFVFLDNSFKIKTPKDFSIDEKILPFFKTKRQITQTKTHKEKILNFTPHINSEKLCVELGKEKIYTLPLFKCRQYDNIEINCENKIINFLMENENLYNYFHSREFNIKDKFLFDVPIEIIHEYIKINKKYNFYNTDFVDYICGTNTFFKNIFKIQDKTHTTVADPLAQDLKVEFIENANIGFINNDLDTPYVGIDEKLDSIKISDLFVKREKIKPWHTFLNYTLYKLKVLPIFEIQWNRKILCKKIEPKYLYISDFIHTLKHCVSQEYTRYTVYNNYQLYELLCNTYIRTNQLSIDYVCEYKDSIRFYLVKTIQKSDKNYKTIITNKKTIQLKETLTSTLIKIELKCSQYHENMVSKYGCKIKQMLNPDYFLTVEEESDDILELLNTG